MGSFVFIKYEGSDAGEVLVTMLDDPEAAETHEIPARVSRPMGFMPNPDTEDEDAEEGEEDDGESDTD